MTSKCETAAKIKICSVNQFRIDSNSMQRISCALKRKVGKSQPQKGEGEGGGETPFDACYAGQKISVVQANSKVTFHVPGLSTLQFSRQKDVSHLQCLSRPAPSVTCVVICVSFTGVFDRNFQVNFSRSLLRLPRLNQERKKKVCVQAS